MFYHDHRNRKQQGGPQHVAVVAKPFAVGMTEVTFAEWDACVAGGTCTRRRTTPGPDPRPAV
jgi:formylglycine-generating enzyme required for sulfatase activity